MKTSKLLLTLGFLALALPAYAVGPTQVEKEPCKHNWWFWNQQETCEQYEKYAPDYVPPTNQPPVVNPPPVVDPPVNPPPVVNPPNDNGNDKGNKGVGNYGESDDPSTDYESNNPAGHTEPPGKSDTRSSPGKSGDAPGRNK